MCVAQPARLRVSSGAGCERGSVKIDLQGLGYLISSISVGFLGAVAWPGPNEPQWHAWAVAIGMATSILGMGVRFLSHLHDKRNIRRAANNQLPDD
jgi:hypothetical protein